MKKIFFALSITATAIAQQPTVGLLQQGVNDQLGYVLFSPLAFNKTYLIDKCGFQIHSWNSNYLPGCSVYLLPDGNLLRAGNTLNQSFNGGGKGGIIEKIDWNGNVIWSYQISSTTQLQHHDIEPLPNGNILAIVWEKKSVQDAINEGRDPNQLGNELYNEKIIEIQPVGNNQANIVWEWNIWDHLVQDFDITKQNFGVIAQHPELIDINLIPPNPNNPDWVHLNSVKFNAAFNQLILSSRLFSEVLVIDHSTTTAEASSHAGGNSGKGGDILYRWGNPENYDRGDSTDRHYFGQHTAHWINAGTNDLGNIIVFNNGKDRPSGNISTIDIIAPPVDINGNYSIGNNSPFLPDSAHWVYEDVVPTNFFSNSISGVQRLSNNNTLVCTGTSGWFFEIDPQKNIVWQYKSPVNASGPVSQGTNIFNNNVFRCTLYEPNYSGFSNHVLIPGPPIELNPYPSNCIMVSTSNETETSGFIAYPNPFGNSITIYIASEVIYYYYSITDVTGKIILPEKQCISNEEINTSMLASGIYFLQIKMNGKTFTCKMVK